MAEEAERARRSAAPAPGPKSVPSELAAGGPGIAVLERVASDRETAALDFGRGAPTRRRTRWASNARWTSTLRTYVRAAGGADGVCAAGSTACRESRAADPAVARASSNVAQIERGRTQERCNLGFPSETAGGRRG